MVLMTTTMIVILILNYIPVHRYVQTQVTLSDHFGDFATSFLPSLSRRQQRTMSIDEIIEKQEYKNKKLLSLNTYSMNKRKTVDDNNSTSKNSTKRTIKIRNEYEHDELSHSTTEKEDGSKKENVDEDSDEIEINETTTNKKKKFFLIHVGPSKTGFSKIITDTTNSNDPGFLNALQKDGVIYVGDESPDRQQFKHNVACSREFVKVQLEQQLQKNIFVFDMPGVTGMTTPETICTSKKCLIDCWNHNNDNSKYKNSYNMLGYSIIDSNKQLSWKTSDMVSERFDKKFRDDELGLWTDHLDYTEVIGVVTYRRYYDWLISVYKELTEDRCIIEPQPGDGKEGDEVDILSRMWQEQFTTRKRALWPKDGGERCPSIWLWINRRVNAAQYNARFYQNLDVLLPVMQSVLLSPPPPANNEKSSSGSGNDSDGSTTTFAIKKSVEILNYYQNKNEYNSITTELYCGILGNDRTPNTCEYSRSLGRNTSDHGKAAADDDDDDDLTKVLYDEVVVAASDRGWFNKSNNQDDIKILNSEYKDSKNFSDVSTHHPVTTQRIRIRNHFIDHHTKTLNKTFNDFPLMCPSKTQLQHLLDKSLRFEKMVQPEFYKSSLGREKHIQDFWNLQRTKSTFCWVDVGMLFKDIHSWDEMLNTSLTRQWGEPKRVNIT